jgi:thiamine transporter
VFFCCHVHKIQAPKGEKMVANGLAVLFCLVIFVFAGWKVRGMKFDSKRLARIGLVTALSLVLYMIKIVPFPQGGGCTLMSILPIMYLSVAYGMEEGLICALVVGLTKIVIAPPYFPLQIPLDYIAGMLAIALTPIFGTDSKGKLIAGGIFANLLSAWYSILSGVIFFGQFAPEGMNVWLYSAIYNLSGFGVEVAMSLVALVLITSRQVQLKEARE